MLPLMPEEYRKIVPLRTASIEISIIRGQTCLERCLGKSPQNSLAASSARGRKRRGRLCCRLYYRNGRRPMSRLRLYKRYHSLLRPNFDPLRWQREFWKRHRRERHKRRSTENRGLRADPGRLDISLRLSCWPRVDVEELYSSDRLVARVISESSRAATANLCARNTMQFFFIFVFL